MRRLLLVALVAPVLLVAASAAQARSAGTTVNLVAFSTPKPVVQKLIANFKNTSAGHGVTFTQSYGPSGSQARAIVAGQPADVAFLSNGVDINTLADAGLVPSNWHNLKDNGLAADSIVAFAVRPGNPKHIHTWADLIKPGVQVVTPDPFPSGGAKWNVLAAYGVQRKGGASDNKATAYVQTLFHHVVSQDSSASLAMSTFLSGKGDVLLTYESEAKTAIAKGANITLVDPQKTMLIELPMVALKNAPSAAKAFIAYCQSTAGQNIFSKNGYWTLKHGASAVNSMNIFGIGDTIFGGWRKANTVWFAPNTGRMVKIEQNVGGPTH